MDVVWYRSYMFQIQLLQVIRFWERREKKKLVRNPPPNGSFFFFPMPVFFFFFFFTMSSTLRISWKEIRQVSRHSPMKIWLGEVRSHFSWSALDSLGKTLKWFLEFLNDSTNMQIFVNHFSFRFFLALLFYTVGYAAMCLEHTGNKWRKNPFGAYHGFLTVSSSFIRDNLPIK